MDANKFKFKPRNIFDDSNDPIVDDDADEINANPSPMSEKFSRSSGGGSSLIKKTRLQSKRPLRVVIGIDEDQSDIEEKTTTHKDRDDDEQEKVMTHENQDNDEQEISVEDCISRNFNGTLQVSDTEDAIHTMDGIGGQAQVSSSQNSVSPVLNAAPTGLKMSTSVRTHIVKYVEMMLKDNHAEILRLEGQISKKQKKILKRRAKMQELFEHLMEIKSLQ